MQFKKQRSSLLFIVMMSFSAISFAQVETSKVTKNKVTIKMTYEDSNGEKHTETKELIGAEADNFDIEAYEKEMEARDIKILNMDISKSSTQKKGHVLHEEHKMKEKKAKKSTQVKKTIIKTTDGKTKEIIEEVVDGDDSDTYNIKEKEGNIFVNGKEVKGKKKEIKIIQSSEEDSDMKVEVIDGKVYINGEEVEESDDEEGKHKIIIKKIGGEDQKNIWISDEDEEIELGDHEGEMIFISEDDDHKPRLGIMIEDGKEVNGATIVDTTTDSPAAKAGLQKGDVVTAVGDQKVYGATSLMEAMQAFKGGDEIKVTYSRSGKVMTSMVKLEEMKGGMSRDIEKKVIIKKEGGTKN